VRRVARGRKSVLLGRRSEVVGCKSVVVGSGVASVSPVVVIPDPPARVVPSAGVPVHVVNVMGLREHVSRKGREKTPPGGRFSGAVKNLGDSSEPLLITVSFTDEHTTPTDLTQTTTQMRTKTQTRSGAEKSCDTTPTMRCVLTGARKRTKQPGATTSLRKLSVHKDRSTCS